MFTMAYVGNHGLHISTGLNLNAQSPVTNDRAISNDFGSLNLTGYLAGSKYNAMQLNLQRSSSHGLTVNTSYTWAHERDDELQLFETYQNVNDLHQEWADGDTDVRNAFSLGMTYDLPIVPEVPKAVGKGWEITSVTQVRSGLPFSVTLPGYLNANTYRPDCVLSSTQRHQLQRTVKSVEPGGLFRSARGRLRKLPT